jgi:NodT family efflux transporter outer membrane factor (OMF) lipoprotein
MNRLFPALLALLLSGCVVGPDFAPPAEPKQAGFDLAQVPAPEKVAATGPRLQTGQAAPEDWWRLLGSKSLDDTEAMALAANDTLAAAKATLRQSLQQVVVAEAATWPQLSLGAGIQRNGSGGFTAAGGGTSSNNMSIGPSAGYVIDLFGAVTRTIEQSQAQADYERLELAAAKLTVEGGVATAALQIAGARLQIVSAEEILADDEQNLRMVERQFAIGKAARTDVLTAQSQLAGDRSQIAQLRQQLSVARHALAVLVSRSPADWAPPEFSIADFAMPDHLPASLPSELVHRRPDIMAAEAQLHGATAAIGIAQAQFYPSISLSAAVTQQSTEVGQLFKSVNNLWSVGASLSQPIYSGGLLAAQKQAAVEAFQAQLATYEQTVITAFGQVADYLRALEHDAEQLRAAQESFNIAEASLSLQRSSYQVGKTSLLQLLTAQRAFSQARQTLATAQVQQLQDVVQFFLAMGGGVTATI